MAGFLKISKIIYNRKLKVVCNRRGGVTGPLGTETLTEVAAGCKLSAMEVEALTIFCSLAATRVDRVPIGFNMSLRVGSDSSSVTKPSSGDARSGGGWAFFLFLGFSPFLCVHCYFF